MKDLSFLDGTFFAHRGLHDNKTIPENSLIAFNNAVDHGYGIEFDVYLTDDGQLIIHHDFTLNRTCGMNIDAEKIDTSRLSQYKLFGTEHSIPLLKDMLALVNGKVPLILEIKATRKREEVNSAIYEMIKDYVGPICVESFDTKIVNWWVKHHNEFVIGQLYSDSNLINSIIKCMGQYRKVDFIALSCKQLRKFYFQHIKKKHPEKRLITWTVRTNDELKDAYLYGDNFIFECNIKNKSYISLIDIENIIDYKK